MEYNECFESFVNIYAQIKQEIKDAREEALNKNRSSQETENDESELDGEEESASHLDNHVTTCNAEVKVECSVCGEVSKGQDVVNKHMKTHENQTVTQEQDIVHQEIDTSEKKKKSQRRKKQHKCDICDKTFGVKVGLVSHMRKHAREKQHKCDICTKSFSHKSALIIHLQTHSG